MNFQQLWLILWARRRVVVYVLLCTVSLTLSVSLMLPSKYKATTALVVDVKSPDPMSGMVIPAMIMPGYMATQVDIVTSERVSQHVVMLLNLDKNPTIISQWQKTTKGKGKLEVWLGSLLQRNLEVKPSRESNVINITYTATDPVFAATVANAFAKAYIETNVDLKVEPARQYAKWFQEQGKASRDELEKAQAKLSSYQKEKGIVALDERLDNETAKLNELSTQLSIAQGQSAEALSKQKSAGTYETLVDVMQNPVIQRLKNEIAIQEAKLQEASGNLGHNHPQFRRMTSEIASLRQKLAAETRQIAESISTSGRVSRNKEAELRHAIEMQKYHILDLKTQRDELNVLVREVDTAQKAYDAVSQRFTQANLESQTTQTNISILTPANEPLDAASPKILLNTLIAVFLGALLGVCAAMLLEMLDRRVRSATDIENLLNVRILAEFAKPRPAVPAWQRPLQRMLRRLLQPV